MASVESPVGHGHGSGSQERTDSAPQVILIEAELSGQPAYATRASWVQERDDRGLKFAEHGRNA
jgi:predicted transcriptional regulator